MVLFYEKPLIAGAFMPPYASFSNISNTSFGVDPNLKTWDVSISQTNDTSVFFFGVGANGLL
jgi:hypothetical protein